MRKLIAVIILSVLSFNVTAQDCLEKKPENQNVQFFAQANMDIFAHASIGSWFGFDRCKSKVKQYALSAVQNHFGLNGSDPDGFSIRYKGAKLTRQKKHSWGTDKHYTAKVRVSDRVEIVKIYTVKLMFEESNGSCAISEVSSVIGRMY